VVEHRHRADVPELTTRLLHSWYVRPADLRFAVTTDVVNQQQAFGKEKSCMTRGRELEVAM